MFYLSPLYLRFIPTLSVSFFSFAFLRAFAYSPFPCFSIYRTGLSRGFRAWLLSLHLVLSDSLHLYILDIKPRSVCDTASRFV